MQRRAAWVREKGIDQQVAGFGEKRVRFKPSARIIPDAWFTVLAKGARFPLREAEEPVKSQLLGRTIQDVAFGEEECEANEETESKANKETECEPEVEGEWEEEMVVGDTPTKRVTGEQAVMGEGEELCEG